MVRFSDLYIKAEALQWWRHKQSSLDGHENTNAGIRRKQESQFALFMSIYAQVGHDSTLGAVLAEYSAPNGASKETIAMRLIDQSGADVGDGWYFSDAPLTKAIFFNVPAGTYNLQVQTRDGYWLGSDTVIVYNETTSFVQLGSSLRYRGSSTKDAKDSSK